ncbi:hypothetical protein [Spiroplasma culicicola]|uniref:Cell division protein FtsA n=1 Tax=Spiroplasma culicicola AES-1 TaxID=1276246 RepID=W6A812_9MOLU|nr:hypothetical protein [Spiroplasma culicicola]AHI53126.1 cell division protein FtsA [Spiroplasma culicicola AES-1]
MIKNEVYAALQITKKEIRFIVGKYRNERGLIVISKDRKKATGRNAWLNEANEVINISEVAGYVNKFIANYEKNFNQKLERILIVYPSSSTAIIDGFAQVLTTNGRFENEDRKMLLHNTKLMSQKDGYKIINIRPYQYVIDQTIQKSTIKVGINAKSIRMMSRVYAVPDNVFNSHNLVIEKCKKEILAKNVEAYVVARQCVGDSELRNPFVILNWEWDNIDLCFFAKETLMKKLNLKYGVKNIVEELAIKMKCKTEVASKYLFKLINFNGNKTDKNVIYRKYLSDKKINFELTFEQIKEMVQELIYSVMDKVDWEINNEFKSLQSAFKIIHNGKITNISGFEKLLARSKYYSQSFVYFSHVTGASEIWTTALCGSIKYMHMANKIAPILATSTEKVDKLTLIEKQKQMMLRQQNEQMQRQQQAPVHQRPIPTMVQPQYNGVAPYQQKQMDPRMFNQNIPAQPMNQQMSVQNLQNNNQFLQQSGIINTQTNR